MYFTRFAAAGIATCLMVSSASASTLFFDDFSSGTLDNWTQTNASIPTVVDNQLHYQLSAFYGGRPITSSETFDTALIDPENPLEVNLVLGEYTWNDSRTDENRLHLGLADSQGNMVLGVRWAFIDEGSAQNLRVYDGSGSWVSQAFQPSWFIAGDELGLSITETSIQMLKNGNVVRDVAVAYDYSETELSVFIDFLGPNNGATVNVDSVEVTGIPEPASLALMGAGALVVLARRRIAC